MTAYVITTPAERIKALHATVTQLGFASWDVKIHDGLGAYCYIACGTRRHARAVARRKLKWHRRDIRRQAEAFEVR